jgi:hypothetical protein
MTERDEADRKCQDLMRRVEYRSLLLCPGCRKRGGAGEVATGLLVEIEVQKKKG